MRTAFLLPLAALFLLPACNNERMAVQDQPVAIEEPPPTVEDLVLANIGGPSANDSLFFSIERTPCFGTCKAYRIDVYRSGFATYKGRSNVEKIGPHSAWVSREMMAQLLVAAEQSGFFDMLDKYDAEVTDLPSTIIRVVANGKDKKVIGRVGQPQNFKTLASNVEELLLPLPWKPVRAEP